MSEPTFPIRPNYTKISDMPGIDGLILRLEDEGIIFGDRILAKDGEENLIVLGSYFDTGTGVREYDINDNLVGELDYVVVHLLLAIGEKAVMWTSFMYVLDRSGYFNDYKSFDIMCMMHIWDGQENMIRAREEFAKGSCGILPDKDFDKFSYTDRSFRYTPVKWISSMFGRWQS